MPHQNTVLDHLFEELASVSEHYMITGRKDRVILTAWVTAEHHGPDVEQLKGASYVETTGSELALVLDDTLGKIALAAPQQVSA